MSAQLAQALRDKIEAVKKANTYRGRIGAGPLFAIGVLEDLLKELEAAPQQEPDKIDAERLDYLQQRGATVEVITSELLAGAWKFRVGGVHGTSHADIRAAIDEARKAQP